jgi:peptidoglycan/LPS O-acetylase OafA/YrhL
MGFNSVLPIFMVGLLCFLVAWVLAVRSRFYRELITGMQNGRTRMIDGLRGWLALGVFFTHTACIYFYFRDGTWDSSSGGIYGLAGQAGVALFFMVTAFLFWGRIMRTEGRWDVIEFFASRVRRIVPMYLVSVFFVLLVVAVASGFELRVSPYALAKEIRPLLSFGFLRDGDINGVKAHHINAVYWSLAFEWAFYLALPLLALYARGAKFALLILIAGVFCFTQPITLCFVFGALAAWIVERRLIPFSLDKHWLTPLPIAALLLAFTYSDINAFMPELLLFVFFLFVVKDNSLFGLLATRGAKVLGAMSYSIYLVHCIVLFVVISLANKLLPIRSIGIETYMALVAGAAVLTVIACALTYRYVEHPFLTKRQPKGLAVYPRSSPASISLGSGLLKR